MEEKCQENRTFIVNSNGQPAISIGVGIKIYSHSYLIFFFFSFFEKPFLSDLVTVYGSI